MIGHELWKINDIHEAMQTVCKVDSFDAVILCCWYHE